MHTCAIGLHYPAMRVYANAVREDNIPHLLLDSSSNNPTENASVLPPKQHVYENLTKTVFGEQEVLSVDEFMRICDTNEDIKRFLDGVTAALRLLQ